MNRDSAGAEQWTTGRELGAARWWRVPWVEVLFLLLGIIRIALHFRIPHWHEDGLFDGVILVFVGAIALTMSVMLLNVSVNTLMFDLAHVVGGLAIAAFVIWYPFGEIPVWVMLFLWVGFAMIFAGMSSAVRRVGARMFPTWDDEY